MQFLLQTPNPCSMRRVWHFSCSPAAWRVGIGDSESALQGWIYYWPLASAVDSIPALILEDNSLLGCSRRELAFLSYLPPAWVMLSEISPYLLAQRSQKPSFQHVQKFHLPFLAPLERLIRNNLTFKGIRCSSKDVDFQHVWRQCPREVHGFSSSVFT